MSEGKVTKNHVQCLKMCMRKSFAHALCMNSHYSWTDSPSESHFKPTCKAAGIISANHIEVEFFLVIYNWSYELDVSFDQVSDDKKCA